jgi:hypothetical protein
VLNKRRLVVVAIVAVAGATTAGQVVMTAGASGAPAAPHASLQIGTTLRLIDQANGAEKLDRSHPTATALLTQQGSGKPAGTAAYTCTNSKEGLKCQGAFALRGGLLTATLTDDFANHRISGQVTGGTAAYAGAGGSVSGRILRQGRATLIISYSFS